jgi:hypothetical protein
MKYIINATNPNLYYSYFIPIVSIMWKAIGYVPRTLLFGSDEAWAENKKTRYVLDNIKRHSTISRLECIPGFRESTCVQVSRIFFSAEPQCNPGDYALTSDADMLPLSKEWFHQQDVNKRFHVFGADAYGRTRFPICYLGGSIAAWREVMGIQSIGIAKAMLGSMDKKRDDWNYDELLFTEKLLRSPMYPCQCHLIDRGWPEGRANRRLDRIAWDWRGQTDLIDCHSLRPGYENWMSLDPLLQSYCSETDFNLINAYRKSFEELGDA